MRKGREARRSIPAVVLGGTGYVAGELLRLLAGHPTLSLAGLRDYRLTHLLNILILGTGLGTVNAYNLVTNW